MLLLLYTIFHNQYRDHYKSCEGESEASIEKYRPSLQQKKRKASTFSPSQQHVKNVQCEECDKWRLQFCKHKLTVQEVADLQSILDDVSYTCGTTFDDGLTWNNVFVKYHSCANSIEKLYYSCGFEPICIYCASEEVKDSDQTLPECRPCV